MKKFSYLIAAGGLLFLIIGFLLLKLLLAPQGIFLVLPYLCLGLGCGAFGYGLGEIVKEKALKSDPKLKKQMEIEKNDERNIAIANKAKAKAYDVMLYVFAALMLAFAFMGVEVAAVLLLTAAYLFVVGFSIYYLNKYQKEM